MKSTISEGGMPLTRPAGNGGAERAEISLHGEILSRLRDYVVEGNIAEGGRIPERQLCEMFGISRTPLREALKVLAAEGLIDLLPNRGARVRQLSRRDLEELFEVMGGLESLAGRLACESITDEEIAEIERLHYEMYGYYLHRDMHNYFQANQRIHEKIVDAARNETLRATYANFAGRIRRVPDESGEPEFLGIFDPKGNLQVMIDFNNDLSEYWQALDTGQCSIHEAGTAVELGVNYAVYAMTH